MGMDPGVLRVALRLCGVVVMVVAELWLKTAVSPEVYAKVLAVGAALFSNTILSWGQFNGDELEKLAREKDPEA